MGGRPLSARIDEYWGWAAVALFLLITVDLLTSMYAVAAVGIEYESNPVMQWLLTQHVAVIVAINVVATALIVVFFHALMELLRYSPQRFRRPFSLVVELWLGGLVSVGLFVFANNLSVIVLGESLL